MSSPEPAPPIAKYELTVTITGNSHAEIESEIGCLSRGGYLLDSDYYKRDSFHIIGGKVTAKLAHTNPEMTPELYADALEAWWQERKRARRAEADKTA